MRSIRPDAIADAIAFSTISQQVTPDSLSPLTASYVAHKTFADKQNRRNASVNLQAILCTLGTPRECVAHTVGDTLSRLVEGASSSAGDGRVGAMLAWRSSCRTHRWHAERWCSAAFG